LFSCMVTIEEKFQAKIFMCYEVWIGIDDWLCMIAEIPTSYGESSSSKC